MPTDEQIDRVIELAVRYMDERLARARAWNERWGELSTFERRASDGTLASLDAKHKAWDREAPNVIYDILHVLGVPGYEKPLAR